MKAMYKYELANAAGVSMRTLNRWMARHRDELSQFDLSPRAQLVPARAVHWICDNYGIDEEEL